jgi:hypothetical protein
LRLGFRRLQCRSEGFLQPAPHGATAATATTAAAATDTATAAIASSCVCAAAAVDSAGGEGLEAMGRARHAVVVRDAVRH